MNKQEVFDKLIPKDRDLQQVAELVIKSPELLKYLISGINEKEARIKYGCNNTLLLLSKKKPEIIPAFKFSWPPPCRRSYADRKTIRGQ